MSENIELARRSFELLREGRLGEWIETFDPEVEWDISAYPLPDWPNTGSGREAFVGHVTAYFSAWNDFEVSIKELIDRGDDVILIQHEGARMPGSELRLDRDLPIVITIRDGRAVRFRVFKTREQAIEATEH
jgi:ketosteroid isomerase-like protein